MKTLYFADEHGNAYWLHPELQKIVLRTTFRTDRPVLPDGTSVKQIDKREFSRSMNVYFNNRYAVWAHNQEEFRNTANFRTNDSVLFDPKNTREWIDFVDNYELGISIPFHKIGEFDQCVIVAHWGRLYYHTVIYNGFPTGKLLDFQTHQPLQWCNIKHCSPVYNLSQRRYI